MKLTLFLVQVIAIFATIAGDQFCYIEGIKSYEWMTYVNIPAIADTDRGVVHTYDTKNITGISKVEDGKYLGAQLNGTRLIFYTTPNFEKFEYETTRTSIEIKLSFSCTENTSGSLLFQATVKDVNNHQPTLDKESYEYNFLMAIPKDFDLTEFGAINAYDLDFTSTTLNFDISDNDDFSLSRKYSENKRNNSAMLKSLRNIPAPYRRQFTIYISDGGDPNLQVSAPLTISVSSNVLRILEFTQHAYYGNYREGQMVEMDEPVKIKKGCDNTTVVRQINYTDYFKVFYNNSKDEIVIKNIKPLPKEIASQQILALGIETETPGVTYVSTITVLIRTNEEDQDRYCYTEIFGYYYNDTYIIIGASLCGILLIAAMNAAFFGICVVYIEIKDVKKLDLETGQPQTSSNGSGFLVSDDGLILTNAHVVINKPKNLITVMLKDGTSYDATVENADMNIDLALLKINSNRKFPYLRLGNSADVTTGEWVIALGSPLSLSHSVTAGVISCIDRGAAELGLRNVAMRYLQTDAAITFGNSGGPLVNLDGDVIGINNLRVTAGIAFAIPVDYAKKFLQQSKKIKTPENVSYHRKQEKCVLGIITLLVTPQLIALLDSVNKKVSNSVTHGVFVWKVLKDTPAYYAGLKPGDIITHVNDRIILDTQNIYSIIEENTEMLTITIVRGGGQQEANSLHTTCVISLQMQPEMLLKI
ncbi:hypothetical protein FQR65_LT07265 [Abscondita terminalis]|nr:hypothetical protein FQR65_LT07265 [Abscondita terminalis]